MMEYFAVAGGRPLQGRVTIHGAKNSALPILAATLLADGESVIHNCPALTDCAAALEILTCLGCVAGIPVGIWLHRFVMERIQVDMVSFRVRISPWSYLLALALTILITLVADALVMRKIDKIDMAESLKSVE